jgi:hypothetical protein
MGNREETMPFAIPPLLVLTLGVVGSFAVARWLAREARRINATLHPRETAPERAETPPGKLRRDPKSGVYRPD